MSSKRVNAKMAYYAVIALLIIIAGVFYVISQPDNKVEISVADDGVDEIQQVTAQEQEDEWVYVYVCGEVISPDVYMVKKGSRLFEVIAIAGGVTTEASDSAVNMARVVIDGEKIYIPTEEEASNNMVDGLYEHKVSINSANKEVLMTLTGIGEAKADAIIDYRNSYGSFEKIDDIMLVTGIKEAMYNKIKDDITL